MGVQLEAASRSVAASREAAKDRLATTGADGAVVGISPRLSRRRLAGQIVKQRMDTRTPLRIYVDTSVLGGCFDVEFAE